MGEMKKIIQKLQACKGYVSLSNEECERILSIIEGGSMVKQLDKVTRRLEEYEQAEKYHAWEACLINFTLLLILLIFCYLCIV